MNDKLNETFEEAVKSSNIFTGLMLRNIKFEYRSREEILVKFYDIYPEDIKELSTTNTEPVSPVSHEVKSVAGRPFVSALITLYKSHKKPSIFIRSNNIDIKLPCLELKLDRVPDVSYSAYADLFLILCDKFSFDVSRALEPNMNMIMKTSNPGSHAACLMLFYRYIINSKFFDSQVKDIKTYIDSLLSLVKPLQ